MNEFWIVALSGLLATSTAAAQTGQRAITILAPVTCSEWIDGRKAGREVKPLSFNYSGTRNEFWLLGLVTGLNAGLEGSDLLRSLDSALIFDWMDRYCGRNRTSSLFDGAEELLSQVARRTKQ